MKSDAECSAVYGPSAGSARSECAMAACRWSLHSPCRPSDTRSAQQPNDRNNKSDSRKDSRAHRGPEEKDALEPDEEDDESEPTGRRPSPPAELLASIANTATPALQGHRATPLALHTIESQHTLVGHHSLTRYTAARATCGPEQ